MNQLDLYDNLGNAPLDNGRKMKKKVFDIKKNNIYKTNSIIMSNIVRNLGLNNPYFADRTYYYLDLSVMKDIIAKDWVNKRKYLSEVYDCDNFAESFKEHMSSIYLINGVALAKSIDVTLSDGTHTPHRACLFFAKENGLMGLYLLEAQNDKIAKIVSNQEIELGNWKYKLNLIEF